MSEREREKQKGRDQELSIPGGTQVATPKLMESVRASLSKVRAEYLGRDHHLPRCGRTPGVFISEKNK